MKDIIIALSSIIITLLLTKYLDRKKLRRRIRRWTFPIVPADALNIRKRGKGISGRILKLKEYDLESVDYRWMTGIYKKDRRKDWVWKKCPYCGGGVTYKTVMKIALEQEKKKRRGLLMGAIIQFNNKKFCQVMWEEHYALHCKDCEAYESDLEAEIHAEVIKKYHNREDLEDLLIVTEGETTEEAMAAKLLKVHDLSFWEVLESVWKSKGKIITESSLKEAEEEINRYMNQMWDHDLPSFTLTTRRLNRSIVIEILFSPALFILDQFYKLKKWREMRKDFKKFEEKFGIDEKLEKLKEEE